MGTADSLRAAALGSAIVEELGGYDRAARQLVAWLRELIASGKAPAESMRAIRTIVRLVELASPAEPKK